MEKPSFMPMTIFTSELHGQVCNVKLAYHRLRSFIVIVDTVR